MQTASLRQKTLFHGVFLVEGENRQKDRGKGLHRMIPEIKSARWLRSAAHEYWGRIVSFSQLCSSVNRILRKYQSSGGGPGHIYAKAQTTIIPWRNTLSSPLTIAERCWDVMFPSRAGSFAKGYYKYRMYRRAVCENHGYTILTVLAALIVGISMVLL